MRFFLLMLFACNAIAAEAPVSQPVFIPSPRFTLARPFVAANDGGFLAAWDEVSTADATTTETAVVKIRTFHEDGRPRQSGEVFVTKGAGARAAWNGSEYVVAYAKPQFRRPLGESRIAAVTRVNEDGRVLGNELTLAIASYGVLLGLACDRQHCLALLSLDFRETLILFDPAAGVLQTADVSTWGLEEMSLPLTARTGGGFAMLRRTGGVTELVTITTTGAIERVMPIPFGQGVAAKDGEYAVVGMLGQDLVAAVLDGNGKAVRAFASMHLGDPIAITPARGGWIAAISRTDGCTIQFGRDLPFSELCEKGVAAVSANGFGSMAAWTDGDQVRSVFTQSGQLPDRSQGDLISVVAAPQSDASAAVDDQGLLLAWSERNRVFLGGDAVGDLYADSPRLSVAGAQTLFLRVEDGHLLASRFLARIAQLPLIEVADRVNQPAISTDGHEWLVAWTTYDQQIRVAGITANGDVLTPGGTAILQSSFKQREPSVAWDGSAFRVAWIEETEEDGGRHVRINSRLVDRSGLPIGPESSFGDVHPQESAFSLSSVSLGCTAGACLVVWMHALERTFSGASVLSDGTHGIEKGLFANEIMQPAVVRPLDSGGFEVWHDGRRHVVSPDGDVISSTTWSTNDVIVYDVIAGAAGPIILYARSVEADQLGDSFRLFLLLPKRRAAR